MNSQQIISELLELINPLFTKEIEQKNDFPIGFTFYHILERIRSNINSLGKLESDSIIKHNHAIGLICRNLLTDFITTGYIILDSKNEDEMKSKFYTHYKSDVEKTDSFLQTQKEIGNITEEDFQNLNKKYLQEDNIHYIIRKNSSNKKGAFQIKQIIEKFGTSDTNNIWKNCIVGSYDLWFYFSKYEHFGWNSYYLTRNQTSNKIEYRLKEVLFYTSIMTSSCFEFLKQNDKLTQSIELVKKIFQP